LNPRPVILKLMLASENGELTARDAVAACQLLGIRENSTRVALVRLASAQLIEAAGRGTYRMGPQATGLANEVSAWRTAEERIREWDGAWIAVHTGALNRADRVALHARERALELLGLRELERGLHVRPDNLTGSVAAIRERLQKLAPEFDAPVFVARDFDNERDGRARKLWSSKALTRGYRETRRKLEDWLADSERLEVDVAARESYLIGDKAIRQLLFDPLLPSPLVDVDERRKFRDAVLRMDRVGHAIWQSFLYSSSPHLAQSAAHPH
jgi:phenylacetic acid degradation operon negative regulatory protein